MSYGQVNTVSRREIVPTAVRVGIIYYQEKDF
jgi:hypothetical protein